ncbi:MAG: VanZ family protein [Phycisphaerae bacterium]|nr:VanZ family protein [Phycisphaerae bacterium]
MRLLRRHKSILIVLGIYWPAIFWLTHIPVPAIARQSGMSDKTMHVLAYFVLAFLVWFAISPYEMVQWSRKKVWILLAVILFYAGIDEFLQGRVGRSADIMDFVADLFGMVLCAGLLSLLNFWPALLVASAVFVFIISNMSHLLMLYPHYHLDTVFHYTAYTAFALIWIQHMERYTNLKAAKASWLFYSLLVPITLLILIKGAAPLFDRTINWIEVATALFGISSAILISHLTIYLSRKSKKTR